MLHVDTHLGISESTLRRQMAALEPELARYQREQEAAATCACPEITVGSDEVYLSRQPILVLMDLVSGYLLTEQMADDRQGRAGSGRLRAGTSRTAPPPEQSRMKSG